LWDQLYQGRNFRNGFNKGFIKGIINTFYTLSMSDGKALFKDSKVERKSDADITELA